MLTYEQSLDFIHSIERFGSKPGLRRVRMLLERMGNPQDRLRFIHVAGTDGKGSTCAMLSSILSGAGFRTGLYISPFIVDFRERIQLDNEMISRSELARSTTVVKEHWDALDAIGETPTEFEVVVAVAFDFFARMNCSVVVLEVGLGGRQDATNVIGPPLVSVITHLSLDHREYLGDTIQQIAEEKCGIIKRGGVTVSYPRQDPAALEVILRRCAEEDNELRMANRAKILSADIGGSTFTYNGCHYRVPLAGEHQVWNAVTAIEAVKSAALPGLPLDDDQITEGIARVTFPARVEVVARDPLVLLDGGHNPAEAAALAATLELLSDKNIHIVIGMLADKDVQACLSLILPHCVSVTAVTPDYPRALPAEELAGIARRFCGDVAVCASGAAAVEQVYGRLAPGDAMLVCGSLYLAGELRPTLLEITRK